MTIGTITRHMGIDRVPRCAPDPRTSSTTPSWSSVSRRNRPLLCDVLQKLTGVADDFLVLLSNTCCFPTKPAGHEAFFGVNNLG